MAPRLVMVSMLRDGETGGTERAKLVVSSDWIICEAPNLPNVVVG